MSRLYDNPNYMFALLGKNPSEVLDYAVAFSALAD